MLKSVLPLVAALGLGAGVAGLAHAQSGGLIIYGNDKCPENTICVRAPESERYRIPRSLRQSMPAAGEKRWGDRVGSVLNAGATGTGSCTASGPGGTAGCWTQSMQAAKAERQADAAAAAVPER